MKKSNLFQIYLTGRIYSNSQKAITLENSKKLGELKNKQIIYSIFEALYLIETKKAELIKNHKTLSKEQIIKIFSKKQKNFYEKYLVFKHLREKGYVVKTALKFGSEFRVYEKNSKHAKWIVHLTTSKQKINWQEFIAKNRIAHSTAKKLLIAIVDSEEDLTFYEAKWIKP